MESRSYESEEGDRDGRDEEAKGRRRRIKRTHTKMSGIIMKKKERENAVS